MLYLITHFCFLFTHSLPSALHSLKDLLPCSLQANVLLKLATEMHLVQKYKSTYNLMYSSYSPLNCY